MPEHTAQQDGLTPLIHAATNDHLPIVEYLLQHGAEVDTQDYVRTVTLKKIHSFDSVIGWM